MPEVRMLIAGGGTGGHLFPAMAVAEEFLARDPGHRVLFAGTAQGLEARLVPEAGWSFTAVRSRGIAGKGMLMKMAGLVIVPVSVLDALRILRRFRPHLALGVGGYVSGPVILAAGLLGLPSAIQEQNAVPGWTNRLLGLIADRVFLSFEPAAAWFPRAARRGRIVVTGNPVRRAIVEALQGSGAGGFSRSGQEGRMRLLVIGGSQGAHGVNLLMQEAAAILAGSCRDRLIIRHQSGSADREAVEGRYRELGLEAAVEPFIKDMASAYGDADLVVSRSGAGAVAEIALAGRASILVPFPFAASDHQALNARVLVDAGAAVMFRQGEATAGDLAAAIQGLLDEPDRREEMARRAKAAARPEAAAAVVDHCLEIARP